MQQHCDCHGTDAAGDGRNQRRLLRDRRKIHIPHEFAVHAIDPDVDDDSALLYHIGRDKVGLPDRRDQNIGAHTLFRQIDGARMTNCHGRIGIEQQERHRTPDNVASADDDGALAARFHAVAVQKLHDAQGRAGDSAFLVSRKSDAEFVFDINLACSKSDENPVYYLQYAHARICSVLRQAQEKGFAIPAEAEAAEFDLSSLTGTAATALAAKFAGYGETLAVAARDLAPHLICVYLKELAADFHTFYNAERVLVDNEAERNARLALCMAARRVLANGLEVLGVSAPERM